MIERQVKDDSVTDLSSVVKTTNKILKQTGKKQLPARRFQVVIRRFGQFSCTSIVTLSKARSLFSLL